MKLSFRNVVLQEIEDYWLYFHNCFFFFTNLNPTAGEGCLTLADFGDKLTPRGLPVFGLGDMNKTSAKLKYHLEVYSYKCPQKKTKHLLHFLLLQSFANGIFKSLILRGLFLFLIRFLIIFSYNAYFVFVYGCHTEQKAWFPRFAQFGCKELWTSECHALSINWTAPNKPFQCSIVCIV